MDKDSRNKLIEVALPLFAVKGYEAVSIRELAEVAGVNSALITYHFGGKEGLYNTILESQFDQIMQSFNEMKLKKLEPVERIVEFARYLVDIHIKFPYFRQLLNTEIIHPSPGFETIVKGRTALLYQFFYETVQEGIAQGVFNANFDPVFVIIAGLGMIHYYFMAHDVIGMVIPLTDKLDEEYGRQIIKILLEGIYPRK